MQLYIVDAFAETPFSGNQAAVCLLQEKRSEAWLQAFAKEMNFSETAYVLEEDGTRHLRWFTPAYEVDLCGHATLATAHTLWSESKVDTPTLEFQTRSGLLKATRDSQNIRLDFPLTPVTQSDPSAESSAESSAELLAALGVKPHPAFFGHSRFDAMVVLESEADVRALRPDFARLRAIDIRGIIATARSDSDDFDFVSRFFAPGAGIEEDPVTGSAHCCLAGYWAEQLNKTAMVGFQASERGGIVGVEVHGDRVHLKGQAITIVRGQVAESASTASTASTAE
ncbi:MAG: PhzF family phenazine biosynthesis protein [Pirellulaceae bacterium]